MSTTTVRVTTVSEIQVTPENEREILSAEYDRRYSRHGLDIGDDVRFIDNGRPKQREFLGEEHVGKPGIVVALGERRGIKVLAISSAGDFVEVWTLEECVERID